MHVLVLYKTERKRGRNDLGREENRKVCEHGEERNGKECKMIGYEREWIVREMRFPGGCHSDLPYKISRYGKYS